VRIPRGRLTQFHAAYAELSPGERFARQRATFLLHRVAKGQTIVTIAKRYKTTVAAIQVANGIREGRRLKPGQRLRIPVG
jgi:membrane-bound lytic murein transglycosylase D